MPFEEMEFGYYTEAERKARRAFEHYEDGKMTQALDELETAIELNPANSAWHFNKGLTLDAVNRFEDAITEYEIALQLSPHDLEILNSLAIDYTRTGHYDQAIDFFEQIEQLDPNFEPSYCNRIITYTEMDMHDLAEQMFYLAQQIKPDCALCYYNIGNSLFVRAEYEKAVGCWQKTAELEPTHPQINYRIAQAYWAMGNDVCAREHFLAELRNNPGDVDVIFDFGLFLLQAGDVESAKEKYNRILELKPDFAPALFYLGEIAFDADDHERAAQLFTEAMQRDNTLTGPRYRLAQLALRQGRKQQAHDYLLSEMRLTPQDADTLVSMGSMFLLLDQGDCATHCLLQAVDIDSANADGYYYLGLACAADGRLDDAAEFFGHAFDIRAEDVGLLRDSALVYLAMGRLDEAAERTNQARALAADDATLKMLAAKIRLTKARQGISGCLSRLPRAVKTSLRRR
ncbi:MAG: tetratricopeptide repeat protein [Planctomycetota bacterium]|jgi:tetratricopeptide (TPR) repeat protein